jgi:hypothetical protein
MKGDLLMIFIPTKWVPYVIIILGVFGLIVLVVKGGVDPTDTLIGIVICSLAVIGSSLWLIFSKKRKQY